VQGGAAVPLAPRFGPSGRFGLGLGLRPAPNFGLSLGLRAASSLGFRAATSLGPSSRVALRMDLGLGVAPGRDVATAIARGGSSPGYGEPRADPVCGAWAPPGGCEGLAALDRPSPGRFGRSDFVPCKGSDPEIPWEGILLQNKPDRINKEKEEEGTRDRDEQKAPKRVPTADQQRDARAVQQPAQQAAAQLVGAQRVGGHAARLPGRRHEQVLAELLHRVVRRQQRRAQRAGGDEREDDEGGQGAAVLREGAAEFGRRRGRRRGRGLVHRPPRSRGFTTAYSRSTSRFTPMTPSAETRMPACTTG